jgi:uncharacterized protein (TIGR00645 family)
MPRHLFEKFLFAARWLLAPFFIMLVMGLLALVYKAGSHMWEMILNLSHASEANVTLVVLDLIDVTLTGALVVIVILSVYENFVSEVDSTVHAGWPDWMGNINFSELKLKLLSTIVAISAIKLLEAFMDVPQMNDRDLYFYAGLHLTFVVSTLALALAEKLGERHPAPAPAPGRHDTVPHPLTDDAGHRDDAAGRAP